MSFSRSLHFALVAGLSLTATALHADSTNAIPNLTVSTTPFDATKTPWVDDASRATILGLHDQFKAGQYTTIILAIGTSGNWGYRVLTPDSYTPPNLNDLVRAALEQCEWGNLMPCYLVEVNGMSAKDPVLGYLPQPQMLDPAPKRFDYTTVPFVPEVDRRNLRQYNFTANPKALAVSTGGFWSYDVGTTNQEAITKVMDTCKAGNAGQDCTLYALGNFVVMDFSR